MRPDRARVGSLLRLERIPIIPDPTVEYVPIGVRSFGKGIFHYEPTLGNQLGRLRFFEVQADRLVVSNIKGWEGAIAISSSADSGCIASNRFLCYLPRYEKDFDVRWVRWYFLSEPGRALLQHASPGSADRNRTLAIDRFESLEIPLPVIEEQRRVADHLDRMSYTKATFESLECRAQVISAALNVSLSSRPDLDQASKDGVVWRRTMLGEFLTASTEQVKINPASQYRITGIYSFGRGLIDRGTIMGSETSYKILTVLNEDDIVLSKLDGWEGAVAVVDSTFAGSCVSSEYPTFNLDRSQVSPSFFRAIAQSPWFWEALNANTRGSMVRRRRVSSSEFLATEVWLPPLEEQLRVALLLAQLDEVASARKAMADRMEALVPAALNEAFAGVS